MDNNSDVVRRYGEELDRPTIEAMLLALFTRSVPQWPLDDHDKALQAYFEDAGRDRGIRLGNLLEVGLTLELAERYRVGGETQKARYFIRFALENPPGYQPLMRFEREFDPSKQIRWQKVMGLPSPSLPFGG